MKVIIRDSNLLRTVRPLQLTAYLLLDGWHISEETNKAVFWERQLESGEVVEVLVPRHNDFADYAARISDVLQVLEAIENRSQLEILNDLTTEKAGMKGILQNT